MGFIVTIDDMPVTEEVEATEMLKQMGIVEETNGAPSEPLLRTVAQASIRPGDIVRMKASAVTRGDQGDQYSQHVRHVVENGLDGLVQKVVEGQLTVHFCVEDVRDGLVDFSTPLN